ncbi:MAG: LysR family transcriptional regulator [Chloroflexota bacterium]|nr:LysR family transcriptional regulator [Chloroflexota bacterium]
MDLKSLQVLCAIAELGSVSKAAEHVGISQPAASRHLASLETELGEPLVYRGKRPIQLTQFGSAFAKRASPLVRDLMELSPNDPGLVEDSTVTIASTYDFTVHVLPYLVQSAGLQHPNIPLNLLSGTKPAVLTMVEQGEADFGLVARGNIPRNFSFDPLFTSNSALLTPLGHPLSEEDDLSMDKVAQWPFVSWRRGFLSDRDSVDRYRRGRVQFKSVLTLDSVTSVKTFVSLGLGITLGPRFTIDPWDEGRMNVVSLEGVVPGREYGIVTLRGKPLWKSGKLLTDLLHEEVLSSEFLAHFPFGL